MENLPKKVRSKKLSTRVDLTAMVSVSFLLIIFFMVTIELAKPRVLDLGLPERYSTDKLDCVITCGTDPRRIITILLDKNDKIVTYSGLLFAPVRNPQNINYGKNGIRQELFNRKKMILERAEAIGKPKYGPIVIIKPSKKSNFKNLVDILDEMAIVGIDTYAIVNDYSPEESNLLASK